jgi:type III secretory pathway component EscT
MRFFPSRARRASLRPAEAMIPKGILDAVLAEAAAEGLSLSGWGLAWARVLPTVLVVPVFGLGILPIALRFALGFVLAASIAPFVHLPVVSSRTPWLVLVLEEFFRGLPVAAAASVSLWAATVAGGLVDHVTRASRAKGGSFGITGGSPFATLLFLLASVSFLELGGAERVSVRLATAETGVGPLTRAVQDLAAGIELGVGIGAPMLLVALVLDLTSLVASRELWTNRAETTLAPLRSLVLFVATAALLDRMADAVTRATFR